MKPSASSVLADIEKILASEGSPPPQAVCAPLFKKVWASFIAWCLRHLPCVGNTNEDQAIFSNFLVFTFLHGRVTTKNLTLCDILAVTKVLGKCYSEDKGAV